MPYLNLSRGEPWAETWGVMLFPDDDAARRAFIATLWLGFTQNTKNRDWESRCRDLFCFP
jgi:hypothetical protein